MQPGPYSGVAALAGTSDPRCPHRAGESRAAPSLSPQAESGRATSLAPLPWLQSEANIFLYGRAASSCAESVGMVTSSPVKGEIGVFRTIPQVLLAHMLLLRVVSLFLEGIRPTSSHQLRRQEEPPGWPLAAPHCPSTRQKRAQIWPRSVSLSNHPRCTWLHQK